jgi:lysozyme family protein
MNMIIAFPLLMKQEGIIETNTPGDLGGDTKFGIAQASHPGIDVPNLTESQAEVIYASSYWGPAHCADLKSEIQYIHFSCAVNCGPGMAIKILQRASKVSDDGIFGPATLGASNSISICDYATEWGLYYKKIVENNPSQSKFLNGWNNRISNILTWYKQGLLK